MSHYDYIFVDFDETLFNHALLNDWVDHMLLSNGHIKQSGDYSKDVDAYHERLTPILRLYRHNDHFKDATQREWAYFAGELKARLRGQVCPFCYEDAHEFLRRAVESGADVRLLSFGDGEYQRFKIGLCAEIRKLDIPIHIVDRPKREFLAEHFGAIRGVLVDDKYPLDLPDNITHILIDRKGIYREQSAHDPRIITVTTLKEIQFSS